MRAALISALIFLPLLAAANEHGAAPEPAAAHGEGHATSEHAGPPERPAPVLGHPTRVPRALVERIESEYRRATKRPTEGAIKVELLSAIIELTSARAGTLEDEAKWVMAPGGGAFDFEDVVTDQPGSFNLKLSARTEAGAEVVPTHVYFVPRSKVRRLDGETFGDGCDKIMEVTALVARWRARGVDLYTAGQRYLSTLGGTFVITVFDEKALQLAHVTFTDSRYPQLICE